jgi:hypothetical protein
VGALFAALSMLLMVFGLWREIGAVVDGSCRYTEGAWRTCKFSGRGSGLKLWDVALALAIVCANHAVWLQLASGKAEVCWVVNRKLGGGGRGVFGLYAAACGSCSAIWSKL